MKLSGPTSVIVTTVTSEVEWSYFFVITIVIVSSEVGWSYFCYCHNVP